MDACACSLQESLAIGVVLCVCVNLLVGWKQANISTLGTVNEGGLAREGWVMRYYL